MLPSPPHLPTAFQQRENYGEEVEEEDEEEEEVRACSRGTAGRHRAPWQQQGNKLEADTENNKVIMSLQLAAVPTPGTAQRIFTTPLISGDEV